MSEPETERHALDRLAEEFVTLRRMGVRASVSDFALRSPEHREELESLLPVVRMLDDCAPRPTRAADEWGELQLDVVGDYYLVREVGRGGMGIVFEARQKSLDRRVALKILPRRLFASPKRVARFLREAETAARLHHQNIVPVYGVGRQEGTHYYTMEFVEGFGLDRLVEELHRRRAAQKSPGETSPVANSPAENADLAEPGSPPPDALVWLVERLESEELAARRFRARQFVPADRFGDDPDLADILDRADAVREPREYFAANVAAIGVQVADALQYAHDHGVLHRDVKPSNLLLDGEGTAWVTDFGLAKLLDQADLTESSETLGTLRYMAPEQLHGEADARTDVYGLGATLYELLVQVPLVSADSKLAQMRQIAEGTHVPPRTIDPAVPEHLETIVLKAVARDREQRYATAADLAADLRRFLDSLPPAAGPEGPARPAAAADPRRWRRAFLAGFASATAFLVAVLWGLVWWKLQLLQDDVTSNQRSLDASLQKMHHVLRQAEEHAAEQRARAETLERRLASDRNAAADPQTGPQSP